MSALQKLVYDNLTKQDPRLANMYLGALRVLHDKDNSDKMSQAKLTDINPASTLQFLIKDDKTGKVAKVGYNQLKLYCHLCQSHDCIHVDIARVELEQDRIKKAMKEEKK